MKAYNLKRALFLGVVMLLIAGMNGLAEAKITRLLCDAGEKFKELVEIGKWRRNRISGPAWKRF